MRLFWIGVSMAALALLLFVLLRGTPVQRTASAPMRVEPETFELVGRVLPPLDPRASILVDEPIPPPQETAQAEVGLGFGRLRDSFEVKYLEAALVGDGRATAEEARRVTQTVAATVYIWPCDWRDSELHAAVDAALEDQTLDIEQVLVSQAGWGRIARYATTDVARARIWLNCPQDERLALLLGLSATEVAAERERLRLAGFDDLDDLPAY